ncbi:MAG TPA: hypothetical protein VHM48_09145, partial [Candidatus Limnocylindrales bacterium]|nr:hypothetical protein [Candidatus Limnocylindrales bacterium]
MRLPTFSAAVLARLLVLGGALILVGSLLSWVVFSVQPLFGWTYRNGLDLGFGIVTALAGIGILTLGARLRVERPLSAWTAVGLALVTLALVALALVVAMNHDPSDGRMFDGIAPGAIVVAFGAMLAALAGWRFAIRSSAAREPGSSPRRPRWQGAALL